MKKTVLKFGLISGGLFAVMIFATMPFVYKIGFDNGLIVGYTTMVVAFLFVFFGIRSYRETVGNGYISFGRAFTVGILITLISCLFYVIAWEILYFNFMPDFGDRYAQYVIEKARTAGASAEEISKQVAEMDRMKAILQNPLSNAVVTFFIEPFPVGLIISAISALILRKRREEVPQETELVSNP